MQTLIVLLILLVVSYIGYLLFNRKKELTEPEVTVPEVTEKEYHVILEEPLPTQKLKKLEAKEKQVKPKALNKPKAKPVKKEIMVKKEKKSKGKGDVLILS